MDVQFFSHLGYPDTPRFKPKAEMEGKLIPEKANEYLLYDSTKYPIRYIMSIYINQAKSEIGGQAHTKFRSP